MLDKIIERKKEEIKSLNILIEKGTNTHLFRDALQAGGLSVIAEIKRKSPSAGEINEIVDPVRLAKEYVAGGASAISVLTDRVGFGGSLQDLKRVAAAVDVPVLRKDFVIDIKQIAEAKKAGASAILLIVAVLGKKTQAFINACEDIGLDALVEVHDEAELEIALEAGAEIIGVNSRNLKTFEVNLSIAKKLARNIPEGIIKVAESGIKSPRMAQEMSQALYDGVLVGQALVEAKDRMAFLREMKCPQVKICGVSDLETASFALKAGADYIGLVFHPASPRFVSVEVAKEIAQEAKGRAVAVFVDQTGEEMAEICRTCGIGIAQLHGDMARSEHGKLSKEIVRFFVARKCPENLEQGRDFMMYDTPTPGKGVTFDWKSLAPTRDFPFIVAGGLNVSNVHEAMEILHPHIVDISSGVERDGKKDPEMIQAFIQKVKS